MAEDVIRATFFACEADSTVFVIGESIPGALHGNLQETIPLLLTYTSSSPMQIRYHCPHETCVAIIEYEPLEGCNGAITCPRCRRPHVMRINGAVAERNSVDICAVCGGHEFFVRKDFPQRIGLLVVIVFGAAAVYSFTISPLLAFAVLAAAVLIDLAVYSLIGRVTTCYACRAEYRKCELNPAHEGFDLATSEKY